MIDAFQPEERAVIKGRPTELRNEFPRPAYG